MLKKVFIVLQYEYNAWIIERVPLKKIGSADDVAKMMAYFFGDAAGFITGAEVVMDGGMSLAG